MLKKVFRLKQILSLILCFLLIGSAICSATSVNAQEENESINLSSALMTPDSERYADYYSKYISSTEPYSKVVIKASQNYVFANGADVTVGSCHGCEEALLWKNDTGDITWQFSVKESGNYHLRITYYSLCDTANNVQLGVKIDGAEPFFESSQITLPKCVTNATEILQDKNGNDIRPKQIPYEEWITSPVSDTSGIYNEPYYFNLSSEKTHTITLTGALANIAIDTLEFYNSEDQVDYSQYSKNAVSNNDGYEKTYEAEDTLYVSSSILYPVYDRTSVDTSPSDPIKLRYNTIGQSNYSSHGQYIVWGVEAPKDGYYYIGARIRQNIATGMISYRRLYINGEVPFKEANHVKFLFSNKWQDYVFGQENPWLIHLNKGMNQIKLEVVPGDMDAIIKDLQSLTTDVSTLYRKIIMITGVSPDTYRDYHLESGIPNFTETLKSIRDRIVKISDNAVALGSNSSGDFSALKKLLVLIETFLDKPSVIAKQISTLNSYLSSVSNLMLQLKSQPLEIDTITVSSDVNKLKSGKKGIFENLSFQLKSFIGSFSEDYDSIGDFGESDVSINVWINSGRDQANILKSMSDSMFTPNMGVEVNVSLVQQSLVQASLSGSGPDVVLFVANDEPINLAMRNGLETLNQFDTFNDVAKRFQKTALDCYYFNKNYYAVPLTQTFPMLFYRTDIFDELELDVPETWNDFYKVIRVLQHHNLTAGVPNAESSNVMSVNTDIYATLLYQSGEKLYSDDFKSTNLDSELGINAFNMWTDFYKSYGLPYQYDFFNRFRLGDMPMGIYNYSMYGKLKAAAPEIDGLWNMTTIPGTTDENGEINRTNCASGTSALILKGSDHKQEAWKYIDWLTDSDAQTYFGKEIETLLGPSGRYETANTAAFRNLPWTYQEQMIIVKQWDNTFTLPQIPGGYFVQRNLINAFRKVVFYSENSRETIVNYNKTIENEIERKRQEFGLE